MKFLWMQMDLLLKNNKSKYLEVKIRRLLHKPGVDDNFFSIHFRFNFEKER